MDQVDLPQVPDFDFVRPIGEGAFGRVWLAINRATGRPRAVKVICRDRCGARDPAGREVASLARLEANVCHRHPNLLVIHHVGETAECVFYVMDLADDLSGGADTTHSDYRPATLENLLAAGPLEPADSQRSAEQLLAALACLHEAGMVHRDVKPANCLFVGGELKLGDFGLLTADGLAASRLGTLRYMPPDGCMDARADVYAAGLVIYEMTTGMSAERFPSLGQQLAAVAEDPRLARLNRLVLRACDPDPSRRFRDATEMLAELTADEKPPARPRRLRRLALSGIAGIAAIVTFLCLRPSDRVSVNFATRPFEAKIYVDGRLLRADDGQVYRTPCTIPGLPAGTHQVVFEWDATTGPSGMAAGERLNAGAIDFSKNRRVSVHSKAE